ncbi:MAG: hypothetical protein ACLTYN_07970 [Dysosmobacter welbionis]
MLRKTPGTAVLAVTIHEGKNRQVRRMCAQCGLTVQAAPGPGGALSGRSAAGKVAVFDTGRGRALESPLTESGRRRPEWGGVFSIPAARRKNPAKRFEF